VKAPERDTLSPGERGLDFWNSTKKQGATKESEILSLRPQLPKTR